MKGRLLKISEVIQAPKWWNAPERRTPIINLSNINPFIGSLLEGARKRWEGSIKIWPDRNVGVRPKPNPTKV